MIWEPFALAIVFGLVVSAGLYFVIMWPSVEDLVEDEATTDPVPVPVPVPVPDSPSPSPSAAAAPSTGPTESSPPAAPITES